jgi:hypothetical protein
MTEPEKLAALVRLLEVWAKGQNFGRITLSFESGRLTRIVEERSRRPEDL